LREKCEKRGNRKGRNKDLNKEVKTLGVGEEEGLKGERSRDVWLGSVCRREKGVKMARVAIKKPLLGEEISKYMRRRKEETVGTNNKGLRKHWQKTVPKKLVFDRRAFGRKEKLAIRFGLGGRSRSRFLCESQGLGA